MKSDRAEKSDTHRLDAKHPPQTYEILVKGQLDSLWKRWFEGMTLSSVENGESGAACTLIAGPVTDQAALHGLLIKIRDLNLELISVRRVKPGNPNQHARPPPGAASHRMEDCWADCIHIKGDFAMSMYLVALSTWLHVLATIVFVGYYLFTGLIYLPVLECQMQANALHSLLEQISARLRPYFGGSLLIFLVTGTHLMLINKDYPGLGNFFANPWSILIVVKHVLVLAFLALAMFSERAFLPKISDQKPEALKQFRWALNINIVLGVITVLLTSLAQAG